MAATQQLDDQTAMKVRVNPNGRIRALPWGRGPVPANPFEAFVPASRGESEARRVRLIREHLRAGNRDGAEICLRIVLNRANGEDPDEAPLDDILDRLAAVWGN